MKKLVLVLLVGMFTALSVNGQSIAGVSEPIVIYKVDTSSYSNGLQVPAPWYFSVNSLTAEIDTSGRIFIAISYN